VTAAGRSGGSGVALSLGRGVASQLKPGEIVTLRVVQPVAGGQWQVSLSGKLLTVTAQVQLQPGAVMRAVVEKTAGRVLLRLIPDSLPARISQSLGLPNTPQLGLAVDALLQSHMALSAGQVTSVLKALLRLRRQDAGSARVLALLHDRGLSFTSDQVEELLTALEGAPAWAGDADGGQRRNYREPDGNHEEPESRSRPSARAGVRDAVGGALRFFCGRTAGIGDHLLQLFNHIPARHDGWVVIPFGYAVTERSGVRAQEEMSVNGSLRLHVTTQTARSVGPEVDSARLYVSCGGSSWLFGWPLDGDREPGNPAETRRMEIHTDAEPGRASLRELFATVRRLGFVPPASLLPLSNSDGFSVGEPERGAFEVNESL